jgi:fructoselysine-6-P-deglycase FrlB-like protein
MEAALPAETEVEEDAAPSLVEEALRSQREIWAAIALRTAKLTEELPPSAPKRILLFGTGSSHHAARLAGYALMRDRTRSRVPVLVFSSSQIGFEVQPQKGDWAFAFSHRGKTPATLQALQACEREGAFTLLVAGEGVEQPREAHVHLATSPLEKVEPHTVSVTSAICAVTTLLLGSRAAEEWEALRSIGNPDLRTLRERAGLGPSVILGEWEGEWIAREGALKLMEMAGIPVRAYGSEEFFHGPHRSAKPEDSIWHVSMAKDSRNQDLSSREKVLTLGVSGSSSLAWMPTLMDLQWLSLAVALNRGMNPDVGPKST